MALVNVGRNFIAQKIVGSGAALVYNATNAYLGVGDSTSAVTAGQTDLQAATNTDRKGMEATFPTLSTNVITMKSSFDDNNSQFTWNEWGVFNASTAGTMLSRKVQSLGAKGAGETWDLTVTLTVNIGT